MMYLVKLGLHLELIILKVFSKLNDSIITCYYDQKNKRIGNFLVVMFQINLCQKI